MSKFRERAVVLEQTELLTGIFSLWIRTEKIAGEAGPGQFLSLYSADESRMLPRPISICEIDLERNALRLVYRVAGKGTAEFSGLKPGEELDVVGPLGNGFPLDRGYQKVFLVGGGIGIPPMVQLAKELSCEKQIVVGYRDCNRFLQEELEAAGTVYYATEDGSVGTRGNVLDAIRENALTADAMFACGPTPMLRALKAYAEEQGMDCYLSLEERMACGIGACLACVCKSMDVDAHTHVKNKRICQEGPVFEAGEIDLTPWTSAPAAKEKQQACGAAAVREADKEGQKA